MLDNKISSHIKIDVFSKNQNYPYKITGIYMITCEGNVYIGQALDIENRFRKDYRTLRCECQRRLYNSFKKHGVENHIFEIIHKVDVGFLSKKELIDELNKLETYYVKIFNSFSGDNNEFGLNLTRAGDSRELSNETKNRIGDGNRNKKRTKETILKLSLSHLGKKQSPESILKRAKSLTGQKRNEETKKILSEKKMGCKNHNYGKHTIEAAAKRTEIWNNKSQQEKDEIIKNRLDARKNKSKEEKEILRNKLSKTWNNKTDEEMFLIQSKKLETRRNKKQENPLYYSNPKSIEQRLKISKTLTGRNKSIEIIEKIKGTYICKSQYEKDLIVSKRVATMKINKELIEQERKIMIF